MPLAIGSLLGPYEILAPIGAGGMGEVYRARDNHLKRDVALKVLPEAFANDPERLARFQREAELLASLNHPNIAHIYGVEKGALAMELVEGQTLRCPLPIATALNYATQIAEALEYAHERGVIHRDLKPSNVRVTADGVVKLLDFGLAKAIQDPDTPTARPESSPTITLEATRAGVIMGTAAYMAPEQANGKNADRRSDVWSFGALLYEMLAGKRAFEGESVSDTLASVLKLDPDWRGLPAATPGSVIALLHRCLTKDRKQRLQAIGEARITLESPSPEASPKTKRRPQRLAWVIAAAATLSFVILALIHFRPQATARPIRFSIPPPRAGAFATPNGTGLAVSPDGSRVAFIVSQNGQQRIWVRELDSLTTHPVPETEGALGSPFWSPDGRFLGFFTPGKLKKIAASGGPAVPICDASPGRSATWSKLDIVVFQQSTGGGLYRVSASGGTPSPVTTPDASLAEAGHRFPFFLPDGHHFLYTAWATEDDKSAVYVGNLESTARRKILSGATNAEYAAGYLLFMRESTLMAQPFNADKGALSGEAEPVAPGVDYVASQARGQFSVSQTGVLAFLPSGSTGRREELTWFDRSGKVVGTIGAAESIRGPAALSPDGSIVAEPRIDFEAGTSDVWLHDVKRGTASRFTFDGGSLAPVWSPDGSALAFASSRAGNTGNTYGVYQKTVHRSAQENVLEKGGAMYTSVDDWSSDGRYIIEERQFVQTGYDIWVLPMFGDRKPFPYLQTKFDEQRAKLSPDGRWLAYQSNETGRNEIYIQTFPEPGGKWQVSTNGGRLPVWSKVGRELFYIDPDGRMMAADVKSTSPFEVGIPKALFDARLVGQWFDVRKDGRFLIPVEAERSEEAAGMTVVLNWPGLLKP